MKRNTRIAVSMTAAFSLILAIIPATASAAPLAPVSTTKTVEYSCEHDFATFGNKTQDVTLSPERITATYPKVVAPGSRFTITIQPGQWSTTAETGRIRYDIALPRTGTVNKVELANQGSNITAKNSTTSVIRVNNDGIPDSNGHWARISGDNLTIDNGPKSNNGNNAPTGMGANPGDFTLPAVRITMTAPNTQGASIVAGLRNAGSSGISSVSLLEYQRGKMWGWNNDGINCSANTAGRELSTTIVGPIESTTTFTSTDTVDLTWENPTAPDGKVKVNVTNALGDSIDQGEVEFTIGDTTKRVPVSNGSAQLTDFSFLKPSGRETSTEKITAKYLGTEGLFNASTSTNSVTVNVAPKVLEEIHGTVALEANANYDAIEQDNVPVTLTAAIGNEESAPLPEGLKVTFLNGDRSLGEVPVVDGVATLKTTVPNAKQEHSFSATVAELFTDNVHFNEATDDTTLVISPTASTSLQLQVDDPSEARLGSTVSITAMYSTSSGSAADSEVIFRNNGIRIGTAPTNEEGMATLNYRIVEPGDHYFTAFVAEHTDEEDRRYPAAETPGETLTIDGPQSHTSVVTLTRTTPDEGMTFTAGEEAEFKATVDTGEDTVEGNISLYQGDTLIATEAIDTATKTATFRRVFTTPGDLTLHARFHGGKVDADGTIIATYSAAESSPLTLKVAQREITVSLPESNPGTGPGTDPGQDAGENADNSSSSQKEPRVQWKNFVAFFTEGPLATIFAQIFKVLRSFLSGASKAQGYDS